VHELTMMLLADSFNPDLVQLGPALPNPLLMPIKKINRIMTDIIRQNAVAAHRYLFPPGLDALRTQMPSDGAADGNLSPNDILITSGGPRRSTLPARGVRPDIVDRIADVFWHAAGAGGARAAGAGNPHASAGRLEHRGPGVRAGA
jgi:hypothetical protein